MSFYTSETNAQIVIALLKAHGIKHVIASPGTTNMAIVASIQFDKDFEVHSSVDERSAAYIACGLAAELGEPVALSCTGATASRNYYPGLTEAYYRKLPVLAITSSQAFSKVGHHVPQVIDRSSLPNDVAKISVALPIVKDLDDVWECEIKVNQAILELRRAGGGPAHINLPTTYSTTYDVKELPSCRVINRIGVGDAMPRLAGKVAVFIGAHRSWPPAETEALDRFCAANNGAVFCDHTSGYRGNYRILSSLVASQNAELSPDVFIHIGEVSGDYESVNLVGKEVWRVGPDGSIRDTFRKLRYVFEMQEQHFFDYYAENGAVGDDTYYRTCSAILDDRRSKIPDLPFSNIWLASQLAHRIPDGASVHFGILNSLRSWNFFELPDTVTSACNVGGFGIDGGLSTLLGASFANKDKLYFGVIGDLAFFYDMNALGNRHVGRNIRILLVNNGKGAEFRQYNHFAGNFGEAADEFIAAAGHFGSKSPILVKHYAQALGFEYLSARNKQEFDELHERFLTSELTEKPILFEVFTDSREESRALQDIQNIEKSKKSDVKRMAKGLLGDQGVRTVKRLIRR